MNTANGQVMESDFYQTIEVLTKISQSSPAGGGGTLASGKPAPEGIHSLVEMIKMASERLDPSGNSGMGGPTAQLHSGIAQVMEHDS